MLVTDVHSLVSLSLAMQRVRRSHSSLEPNGVSRLGSHCCMTVRAVVLILLVTNRHYFLQHGRPSSALPDVRFTMTLLLAHASLLFVLRSCLLSPLLTAVLGLLPFPVVLAFLPSGGCGPLPIVLAFFPLVLCSSLLLLDVLLLDVLLLDVLLLLLTILYGVF